MSLDLTRDDLNFTGQSDNLAALSVNSKFSSHGNAANNPSNDPLSQTVVRADANDDRPINATGKYDLSGVEDDDDFELFDNYSEVEIATVDDNLIDNVKQVYESILNASMEPFTKKKSLEVDEDKNKTL